MNRRNKVFHKIRCLCQLTVMGLTVKGTQKSVNLLMLHLLERNRGQPCRFAEGDVCLISAACRPVVVGAEIQVILPILFNLAVRIHRDDLVAHLLCHKVDIFPLAACNALIFFRQIKFDGGRCNQIVHLYPIQLLGIGADDPRILFRQRLTGAENLHPHIAVQKQAAHLLACGSLFAQAVSRCIRVAVSVIVNCRGLRLFCQLLLWLLLSFRLRLRQLLALLGISSCRMDADIIRVNTLHLFQLRCQRHQLLPLRKGVGIVGIVLLGILAGKPAAQAPLRLCCKLSFFHLGNGGLGQNDCQDSHQDQQHNHHTDVDQIQLLRAV